MMDTRTATFPPCTCCKFDPVRWPWENATVTIEACMTRCTYCGLSFSQPTKLRGHLITRLHADQHLVVKRGSSANTKKRKRLSSSLSLGSPSLRRCVEVVKCTDNSAGLSANDTSRTNLLSCETTFPTDDLYLLDDCVSIKTSSPNDTTCTEITSPSNDGASRDTSYVIGTPNAEDTSYLYDTGISKGTLATTNETISSTEPSHILHTGSSTIHSPRGDCLASESQDPDLLSDEDASGISDEILKLFQKLSLSTLETLPELQRQLWITYHGQLPQIYSSRQCWRVNPLSDTELFARTLKYIKEEKGFILYQQRQEAKDIDPVTALAQLWKPDIWNPLKLGNLSILDSKDIQLPMNIMDAYRSLAPQVLLATKFSWSQLHFDTSDVFSMIINEGGVKIFATFPASPKNLQLIKSTEGRESDLEGIVANLEGGLLLRFKHGEGIHLPSNCLHKVWTTEGCFLATIDFMRPSSVLGLARLLQYECDTVLLGGFQRELYDWFIHSVDLALETGREVLALQAWLLALERLRDYASEFPPYRRRIKDIMERLTNFKGFSSTACPCGGMSESSVFKEHFREEHSLVRKRKRA